ncbi:hypothetical protein [Nostoc parmelioides]|uniref:Uncharacterized protein n=1 Tax=Nostoc parmelioides FACHB-3921 TaxID=2692909 RepID=A0ABR8BEW0_9NOSO|nr:hypothetical protein [Nostoc parmelioides]MBD2252485.1 hypothetical protein [Nostoc parmelioides FACHB-3921]
MKRVLGILQVSLLFSGVVMCATVTYAAINMATGQYKVEIAVNDKGLNIKSDIDKRECKIDLTHTQVLQGKDAEQKRFN